jgi:hypothetical protein
MIAFMAMARMRLMWAPLEFGVQEELQDAERFSSVYRLGDPSERTVP